MKPTRVIFGVLLPLALGATAAIAGAQGKSHGKGGGHGDDKGKGGGKGKDRSEVVRLDRGAGNENRGRGNGGKGADKIKFKNDDKGKDRDRVMVVTESGGAVGFREFVVSPKRGQRIAGLAVASAARRDDDDAFMIVPVGNRVQVLNRNRAVLVDWDDDRELGNWTVVTEPFKDRKGAPSFCRSGAGHPVWGRQWCIDKGFGLGVDNDVRWSRVIDPSNVIITRPTTGDLTRDALLNVLGSVVLNRLATHAVTLGYQEPLAGRWLGEGDTGSRVLLLSSGSRPVAEVVDLNRDDRADLLLVVTRR